MPDKVFDYMTKPAKTKSLPRSPQPKERTGIGQLVGVRLQPDILVPLDEWIARQPDPKPSRPEAVRRFLERSLARTGSKAANDARSTLPHEVTGKDRF